ncbi:MAG: hypothetical protein AAF289_20515 [Cyanobacteria bacterium P01_A01_bin.135]
MNKKFWPIAALDIAAVGILAIASVAAGELAAAHQVIVEGDIGATLHIEPNDTPRAGRQVTAWFALVRRGGETVPLSACRCALSVYQPYGDEAMAKPALAAIAAEGYQGIPSGQITFPHPGQYELVLTGYPANAESFEPFVLRFEVLVAR